MVNAIAASRQRSHWAGLVLLMGSLLGCAPAQASGKSSSTLFASHDSGAATPSKTIRTAEECRAAGHAVILDTGDGATLKPSFRCPNGTAPLAHVRFGFEGAACCANR